MWGNKKPDEATPSVPERETNPSPTYIPSAPEPTMTATSSSKSMGRVCRTLRIKGELTGSEELVVDGEVEGTIDLGESRLTIASQGRVQAEVRAKEIIIEGQLRGSAHASDRLHIAKSGNVSGDLVAARVSIEDGAYFKGSIDIQKAGEQKAVKVSGDSHRAAPTPLVAAAKDKLQ
jgi:cytoskeletal protein CcmA (bactofilin family)